MGLEIRARISVTFSGEAIRATIRDRYQQASKKDKRRILDEFTAITGHHRKHGIRLVNGTGDNQGKQVVGRRIYDEAVRKAVIVVWEASDRICGKRLKAALPNLVNSMERHGHLSLDPLVREHLLAAIDTMKDQYFGNRHDYIKYALLRCLTRDNDVRTAVCWMLTPPVEHYGGGLTSYLRKPSALSYRPIDEELFKCLREAVCIREERAVSVIEESGLLHDTSFCRDQLTDSAAHRTKYFKEFLRLAEGRELLFFDPDNGLEPTNVRYGQERSSNTCIGAKLPLRLMRAIPCWYTSNGRVIPR